MNKRISRRTMMAVRKYGLAIVRAAVKLNRIDGEGPCTVGIYLGLKTNQANAAINAGAELLEAGIFTRKGLRAM